MQTRIAPNSARYQWGSLHEMAQWIADTPRKWGCQQSNGNNDKGASWDLGVRYPDALKMARVGWLEGAERVQEALQAFPPRSPRPDTRTDMYGFRPHVPRFCAGAPDCMIRHADAAETGGGRVLTLVVPLFISAWVEAQRAANFGVAIAQYINQLECDGTRIELIGCFTQRNHSWRTSQAVTIKNADQPLDLAVIAFAIGHPAMFRRIGFALQERSAAPDDRSYGYPLETVLSDLIDAPPGVVILGGINAGADASYTPAKALEYVSKMIETALQAQEL